MFSLSKCVFHLFKSLLISAVTLEHEALRKVCKILRYPEDSATRESSIRLWNLPEPALKQRTRKAHSY